MDELDGLIYRVIGCMIEVHKELGPGFWRVSIAVRPRIRICRDREFRFEAEKKIDWIQRRPVGIHRLDLFVENELVVELKTVDDSSQETLRSSPFVSESQCTNPSDAGQLCRLSIEHTPSGANPYTSVSFLLPLFPFPFSPFPFPFLHLPLFPSQTGYRFLEPQPLARVKNLSVVARGVVEGFISGLHSSPYKGFSVEFAEHREYTAGDDPRQLDYRMLGRTDRLYVKQYEEETNMRVQILLDTSGSMGYSHDGQAHQAPVRLAT